MADGQYEVAVCVIYRLDPLAVSASLFSDILTFNPVEVQETNTETTEVLCNYPNPFNPETTINYNVVDETRVKLVIYNMLGQ